MAVILKRLDLELELLWNRRLKNIRYYYYITSLWLHCPPYVWMESSARFSKGRHCHQARIPWQEADLPPFAGKSSTLLKFWHHVLTQGAWPHSWWCEGRNHTPTARLWSGSPSGWRSRPRIVKVPESAHVCRQRRQTQTGIPLWPQTSGFGLLPLAHLARWPIHQAG